jgi:hypothetical protein
MGQAKRRRNRDPNYGKPDNKMPRVRIADDPGDHEHVPGTITVHIVNERHASLSASVLLGDVDEAIGIGETTVRKLGRSRRSALVARRCSAEG